MVCERQPLVEDDLKLKMTFKGRRPSVKDDLQWKTTFGGRQHLVEDKLIWWNMNEINLKLSKRVHNGSKMSKWIKMDLKYSRRLKC